MIFVTVGTHHQPFERLLAALNDLDENVVVQYGTGERPAGVREAADYLSFEQMLSYLDKAEKVITHAGVGSVLLATRAGHLPLVVPRRADFGEHVDDHQAELTRALGENGTVLPVWDVTELGTLLATVPRRGEAPVPATRLELTDRVGAALRESQPRER